MNTHFKIIAVAVALVWGAASCGGGGSTSVDSALSQIEKIMDKVEKNKTSMTQDDWDALSKELEAPAQVLNKALDSDQVGALKKIKISAALLRYAVVVGEAALHTVSDSMKVHIDDTNSTLQELFGSEELKEAMKDAQKAAEELQKLRK